MESSKESTTFPINIETIPLTKDNFSLDSYRELFSNPPPETIEERAALAMFEGDVPPDECILTKDIPPQVIKAIETSLNFILKNGCGVAIDVRDTDHCHILVTEEDSAIYDKFLGKRQSLFWQRMWKLRGIDARSEEKRIIEYLLRRTKALFFHTQEYFDYALPPDEYKQKTGVERGNRNVYCEIDRIPEIAQPTKEEIGNGTTTINASDYCKRKGRPWCQTISLFFRKSDSGQIILANKDRVLVYSLL